MIPYIKADAAATKHGFDAHFLKSTFSSLSMKIFLSCKVSFDETKLLENLEYVVRTISKAKPQTVKGLFIDKITISTTMGPGIKVDKNSFDI